MTGLLVKRTPPEMLQGTVDILILRALAWQSMHGYAVSHWLDVRSEGVLSVEGAALYQALHRLERQKWIVSEWGLSENNRKAKYYSLTAAGRTTLRNYTSVWKAYANAVHKVLSPA
jgi:PadR family transcriptional regulator, regulatory protein PadR